MCSVFAYAQNTMVVYTKNGMSKFQMEDLDSITFVTDTLPDQTPQGTITGDNYWSDETNIKPVINGIYSSLSQYVSLQCQVEKTYCLPLLCEDGQVYPLSAKDGIVDDLWRIGYQTISRANMVIKSLAGMDSGIAKEAFTHALVIRSFVYYNMSMLWGAIPYVDENSYDDFQSQESMMAQTQSCILQKLLTDDMISLYCQIRNGSVFVDDKHRYFQYGSLQVLLAEMQLTCMNLAGATSVLGGETQILNIDFPDALSDNQYVNVYTDQYVNWLRDEACDQRDWPINKDDYYWGCWAAYKRTGVAQEKIQRLHPELKHRLLLPIPKSELISNMYLTQNEGYDR